MAQAENTVAKKSTKKATKAKAEIKEALAAPVAGTTAERIALRKMLKDASTSDGTRKQIQTRVIESYQLAHAAAVEAKKSDKAKELKAKIEKFTKRYGVEG
jgi:hypothetical protein